MIDALLRGEAPLWKAFWLFYLLASLLLTVILVVGQHIGLRLIPYGVYINPYGYIIFMAVVAHVYLVVALFSVWRCSSNTGQCAWKYLARTIVVANGSWVALRLVQAMFFFSSAEGQRFLGLYKRFNSF